MKAQITLTSGVHIVVDVDKLDIEKDRIRGDISRLRWTAPDGWRSALSHIAVDQIAAIVLLRDAADLDDMTDTEQNEAIRD